MNFRKSFLIGVLCALMVGLPNWVRAAYGTGYCGDIAFWEYIDETESVCVNGVCIGEMTYYPTVSRCLFPGMVAELPELPKFCDDEARWYMSTVYSVKTIENNSWGRAFECAGVNAACVACLIAATAAGLYGGVTAAGAKAVIKAYATTVASVGGLNVTCFYLCGVIGAGELCCWVDCVPNTKKPKATYYYKKGC